MNVALLLLFNIDENEANERRRKKAAYRRVNLERKVLRNRSNPFFIEEEQFRKLYRLTPPLALDLVELLRDRINMQGVSYIPVHLQVLAVLQFFAEGGYQKGISQNYRHPLGRSTFSRILNRVLVALSLMSDEWVTFPETREERQQVSNRFRQTNRIPSILGLIDCFVVKFVRPSNNEEAFYHHKYSHSMNVQVVCDANHVIRNLRICPGSNNDRHIWRYSNIREKLQSIREDPQIVHEEGRYYFLGDSGYTPSPIMLTPIENAREGSAEALYTTEHVRTRCKVEQTFGILSNVWLAISRRRVLPYKPKKVALIIQAAAVLHNFRRLNGIRPMHNHANNNGRLVLEEGDYEAGILERQRLIHRHYIQA